MHVQAEHQGTRYDCNVCFKQFKRKGSLGRHMVGVHGQGDNKYSCNLCAKEFKQKTHLKTHMKNIHQQGVTPKPPQPAAMVNNGPPEGVVGRPTQVPPPSVIRPVGQPQPQPQPQPQHQAVRQPQHPHQMMHHNGHTGYTNI
jgi:uncharacterized Zn-finger protein